MRFVRKLHDYSKSLNLPKSRFPARTKETPELLKRCTEDLYKWQREHYQDRPQKVFHDGPPYANGELHVGHALNKILKDIVNRFNLMSGHRVQYIPGWDCHGLPIELKALAKMKNLSSAKPLDIRKNARSLALNMLKVQMDGYKKMGIMTDWGHIYRTLDPGYTSRQLRVFQKMVETKLISRQNRPVYWSCESSTALAEAELQYNDQHTSSSVYVKYPLETPSSGPLSTYKNIFLVIWTTTPWTLPANRLIAVHNDLMYGLVRQGEDYLLVANTCYNVLPDAEVLGVEIPGSDLAGLFYRCFITRDRRPVLHGDYVSASTGTGLVHSAPGHGMDDYLLGQEHNLETYSPVDAQGKYTAELPQDLQFLVGLDARSEGQAKLMERYSANILSQSKYVHKFPYDWRHNKPVMIRATPQWFADVSNIKDRACSALENVNFVPDSGRNRLTTFTLSRNEWCISRQRSWGVPIPVLYNENNEPLLTSESVDHIISTIEKVGIDRWFMEEEDISQWIPPSVHGGIWRKGTETMDIWFDSGTSWTLLDDRGSVPPADYYLEGSDQHRGWFQSSLLTRAAATIGTSKAVVPYKNVITHGFTLDEQGRKMSKSIGNVMSPEQVMREPKGEKGVLGVDGLRLWVAQSDYTKDVVIGPTILRHVFLSLKKFRLTFKYLLGNVHDFTTPVSDYKELRAIDKYALHQLFVLERSIKAEYEKFNYNRVVHLIQNHVNAQLSSFYFDAVKDRLYADGKDSVSRRSVQTVFGEILKVYASALSPITPLLVQEMWDHCPEIIKQGKSTPYEMEWLNVPTEYENNALAEDFKYLENVTKQVQETIEVARSNKQVGSSLGCDVALQSSDPRIAELFQKYDLAELFICSQVTLNDPLPQELEWSQSSSQGDLSIVVIPPQLDKCPRCWKYTMTKEEHVCGRCASVVNSI